MTTLDVTPLQEPDPFWVYRDAAGHEHRWHFRRPAPKPFPVTDDPNAYDPHLPTLRWVMTQPATEEHPEEGHYVCAECGERIEPGYRTPPVRRYMRIGLDPS